MKILLFNIYFFVLFFNLSFSQIKDTIIYDNYERSWLTHLPQNYSTEKSYPLVIALHGGGGTAKQLMHNTRKRFNKLTNTEGFIVVYPQGVKKSWNDNNTPILTVFTEKRILMMLDLL